MKCVQYLHNGYLGAGITFFTSSGQELDFHGSHVDVSRKKTFEDPGNGITSLVFNGPQLSSVKGCEPIKSDEGDEGDEGDEDDGGEVEVDWFTFGLPYLTRNRDYPFDDDEW